MYLKTNFFNFIARKLMLTKQFLCIIISGNYQRRNIVDKEFYENFVRSAIRDTKVGYSIIGHRSEKFSFSEGEEREFAKFLEAWAKIYAGKKFTKIYAEYTVLFQILVNNFAILNWEKVWLNINELIYEEASEFMFAYLMQYISLDSFTKKLNNQNDIRLVCRLYTLYGKINKVPTEKMKDLYFKYLDAALKRINSTYETTLNCYLDQIWHCNDDIDIGDNGEYWVILGTSALETFICVLLEKANLDYVIEEKNGTKYTLKNKIAIMLESRGGLRNKLANKFLSLTSDIYFSRTDRCILNFVAENHEEGMRIFNSDAYQLYSSQQYEALKQNGYFNIEELGVPVDRLFALLQSATKSNMLEMLFSDKVKMIFLAHLEWLKESGLYFDEFQKFLEHIRKNNIIIYKYKLFVKQGPVLAFDDLDQALTWIYIIEETDNKTAWQVRSDINQKLLKKTTTENNH